MNNYLIKKEYLEYFNEFEIKNSFQQKNLDLLNELFEFSKSDILIFNENEIKRLLNKEFFNLIKLSKDNKLNIELLELYYKLDGKEYNINFILKLILSEFDNINLENVKTIINNTNINFDNSLFYSVDFRNVWSIFINKTIINNDIELFEMLLNRNIWLINLISGLNEYYKSIDDDIILNSNFISIVINYINNYLNKIGKINLKKLYYWDEEFKTEMQILFLNAVMNDENDLLNCLLNINLWCENLIPVINYAIENSNEMLYDKLKFRFEKLQNEEIKSEEYRVRRGFEYFLGELFYDKIKDEHKIFFNSLFNTINFNDVKIPKKLNIIDFNKLKKLLNNNWNLINSNDDKWFKLKVIKYVFGELILKEIIKKDGKFLKNLYDESSKYEELKIDENILNYLGKERIEKYFGWKYESYERKVLALTEKMENQKLMLEKLYGSTNMLELCEAFGKEFDI